MPASNTWKQLSPTGTLPLPRYRHTAIWDPTGGRMLVFGGYYNNTALNDLWAYQPSTNAWVQLASLSTTDPRAARYNHTAVWDPTNNQIPSDQHILLAWGRDFDDVSQINLAIYSCSNFPFGITSLRTRIRQWFGACPYRGACRLCFHRMSDQ